MKIKVLLLAATFCLTALPGASQASACTEAMQHVQNELNELNAAYASGNQKAIANALRDYFNAVEGANTVCEHDWIGLD